MGQGINEGSGEWGEGGEWGGINACNSLRWKASR
jgi:hypothetical protein